MTKYRERKVVDAVQFTQEMMGGKEEWPVGVETHPWKKIITPGVPILGGDLWREVVVGDWIVSTEDKTFCLSEDRFRELYELVPEPKVDSGEIKLNGPQLFAFTRKMIRGGLTEKGVEHVLKHLTGWDYPKCHELWQGAWRYEA